MVNTFDAEMSQLEAARRIYSQVLSTTSVTPCIWDLLFSGEFSITEQIFRFRGEETTNPVHQVCLFSLLAFMLPNYLVIYFLSIRIS